MCSTKSLTQVLSILMTLLGVAYWIVGLGPHQRLAAKASPCAICPRAAQLALTSLPQPQLKSCVHHRTPMQHDAARHRLSWQREGVREGAREGGEGKGVGGGEGSGREGNGGEGRGREGKGGREVRREGRKKRKTGRFGTVVVKACVDRRLCKAPSFISLLPHVPRFCQTKRCVIP